MKTSSGSAREKWVKALLPAAVILLAYMLLINVGQQRQLTSLRDQMRDAQKSAVTEDAVATAFAQATAARQQRDDVRDRIKIAKEKMDEAILPFRVAVPTERMIHIDRLLGELSIGLLRQKAIGNADVSPTREASIETLRQLVPDEAVTIRQLDLVGHFASLVSLMHRLPETLPGVVPLGIELLKKDEHSTVDPALRPDSDERTWRIYLLM